MMVKAHDGEQNFYVGELLVMGRGNCFSIVFVGHIHGVIKSALYTFCFLTGCYFFFDCVLSSTSFKSQ